MDPKSLDLTALENDVFFVEDENDQQHIYLQSVLNLQGVKEVKLSAKHSKHSRKRASQRSFNYNVLLYVLFLGTPFYRQGLTFYTVMENDFPDNLDHKIAEKIKNLIVVMGNDDHQIITCYYADNAVKHLKRKGKEYKK